MSEKCNAPSSACGLAKEHNSGDPGCIDFFLRAEPARERIREIENSEPAPAHEVSEEVRKAILEKHSEEQNYELVRTQRALEFVVEYSVMINNLGSYIAEGTLSVTLVSRRLQSLWQESFSEAIANRMDKPNGK